MKASYSPTSKSLCFTLDKMKARGEELLRVHKEVNDSLVACMRDNDPVLFLSTLKLAVKDRKISMNIFSTSGLELKKDQSNFLHWIAKNNGKEVFQYFRENAVPFFTEPSKSDIDGYLPLYYALIYEPYSPTGQDKLDNDYIINNLIALNNYSGKTLRSDFSDDVDEWEFLDPIVLAFNRNKQEAVELLFEQGCDIHGLPEKEQDRLRSLKKSQEFKNEDFGSFLKV